MFWDRFYNLCLKHGTKPNPLGKEISISSGIITKWKNENTLPNGETLIKIADYFDCSIDYLLERTNQPDRVFFDDSGQPVVKTPNDPPTSTS